MKQVLTSATGAFGADGKDQCMNQNAPLAILVKTWPKPSEIFIQEEVLGLERAGVPLRLYALEPPADAVEPPATQVRAPLVCVPPLTARHALGYAWRHLRLALQNPLRYLQTLGTAREQGTVPEFLRGGWLAVQLQADGASHLHAHFISTPADVAAAASALGGLPFSISAHARDISSSRPIDLQRRMQAASFTVTCTEFNRTTLAQLAPDAVVKRLYHGIDHSEFNPARRSPTPGPVPLVLAVCRLRADKGLDTLIDACQLLHARGIIFRCQIVGYGEARERLLLRIHSRGLGEVITLQGKLPREQVIARYAQARVFVQPASLLCNSGHGGIPSALLQAMAMGLPVVASRVWAIPEVLRHRHNGLLVEPDDVTALADAITEVLAQPALAASLGRSARAVVAESFDNDLNLQQLTRLLEPRHDCRTHCDTRLTSPSRPHSEEVAMIHRGLDSAW